MGRVTRWGPAEVGGGKMKCLMPGLDQLQAFMEDGIWQNHGAHVWPSAMRGMIAAVNMATAG